jgi:uncharacterized cupin superfamily protein
VQDSGNVQTLPVNLDPLRFVDLLIDMPSFPGYLASARYGNGLPQVEQRELMPAPIDPSWIVDGALIFRATTFQRLPGSESGIWECIGPGKFVWHYGVDETIYALEGSATIEYLGKKFTLHPGDSTRFVPGTTANWEVPDRIKKTWWIRKPGPIVKVVRRILRIF